MSLKTMATQHIKNSIISSNDDLFYWQQKAADTKDWKRKNYYLNKIAIAKAVNDAAKAELVSRGLNY